MITIKIILINYFFNESMSNSDCTLLECIRFVGIFGKEFFIFGFVWFGDEDSKEE